jgi:proline dehydrogenase
MLYGVREDLARRLASEGARVRISVPYGPGWQAYLRWLVEQRPVSVASAVRTIVR